MIRRWLPVLLCFAAVFALPFPAEEVDSDDSRRVLGSSVVTSVSVIMDLGNGTKKYFADAAGKPVPKPTAAALVGSPAQLLNPDRYEFYTFDESGDLVKRLMTLDEIQGIIANGEGEFLDEQPLQTKANYYHQKLPGDDEIISLNMPDKTEEQPMDMGELSPSVPGVHDVVLSVQNVLKEELSKNKLKPPKPVVAPLPPSTISSPDPSWSMIIPAASDQSMHSSPAPNTAGTTTVQPQKSTPIAVEQPSTEASNVGTTIAQPQKPSATLAAPIPANNNVRVTTTKPVKPSAASTELTGGASNLKITTVQTDKPTTTSAEVSSPVTNDGTTTMQLQNLATTSSKPSPPFTSDKLTTKQPQKFNATSTESSSVINIIRITTTQPQKSSPGSTESSLATTDDRTTAQPQKFSNATAESSTGAGLIKITTTQPQISSSTSESPLAAADDETTIVQPQKSSITSTDSSPIASNIHVTTGPQKPDTTSVGSTPAISNVRTTTPQPQQMNSTSSIAGSDVKTTTVQPQKSTATLPESSPAASNIRITTVQPPKSSITLTKTSSAASNVRITTIQPPKPSVTSAKLPSGASNVKITTIQPPEPSVTSAELSSGASNVRITTIHPPKPSVTLAESPPPASYIRITTVQPRPSVSSAESPSAVSNVRITTVQPLKPSVSLAELPSAASSIRTTTVQPPKPSVTSAELPSAASNIRTTTVQTPKSSVTTVELSSATSNIRTTTVQPPKPSVTSTKSPPAVTNEKIASVHIQDSNSTSAELIETVSNLRTTTAQPQTAAESLQLISNIKNTTASPQKLSANSADSSPAISNDKITTVQLQKPSATSATSSPPTSIRTTTMQPHKPTLTLAELSPSSSNVRTTTIAPPKSSIASTQTSPAASIVRTTTTQPQKPTAASAQSIPAEINLKNNVQPQDKINNTTAQAQKPGAVSNTASTAPASPASISESKINVLPQKASTLPTAATQVQTTSSSTTDKNIASTTTPLPEATSTVASVKLQENKSESPTLSSSSSSSSSLTNDENKNAGTVADNEIGSLPTLDVIAQLSNDDEEIAAAQQFINLFTPPYPVSGQSTTISTLPSNGVAALTTTTTSATRTTSFPSTKRPTTPPFKEKPSANMELASTLKTTVMPTVGSSKVPFGSINNLVTQSTTPVKSTTVSQLNSSSDTEDSNILRIEVLKTPETAATNVVPVASSPSNKSDSIPAKTEQTSASESDYSSNTEDVMAELADSLSLVLSQVGGSVTTIDYGEELLLMGNSSIEDSSKVQNNIITTTEADSTTTAIPSSLEDSMGSSQGNYINIMNIKEIMNTNSNKQQNDINSTENKSNLNTKVSAESITSEVKVQSPSYNHGILNLEPSKTKDGIVNEKKGPSKTESKKPTINRYESTTLSTDWGEEQKEEKNVTAGSTNAQNENESNKLLETTTVDVEFSTGTTTVIMDEAITEKLISGPEKNNGDEPANNYKKTDIELLEDNSESYVAEISESSPPTETYQSTTSDFTTTDAAYIADLQTIIPSTASSMVKVHLLENTKEEPVSGVSEMLKESFKQNVTRETTTVKTIESNTLRIQHETTLDITEEQSTENTHSTTTPSLIASSEKVTVDKENEPGVTTWIKITPSERPENRPITREPSPSENVQKISTIHADNDIKVQLQSAPQERPEKWPLTRDPSPSENVLKPGAADIHKIDNKHQVDNKVPQQTAPQERPEHKPVTVTRDPLPSGGILKLGETDTHKVDNKVPLQTVLQERPEHKPVTRDPSPSGDILKLGATDTHKVDNKVPLQTVPQERPEHRPLTRDPYPSEDILKFSASDTDKFDNKVQLQPAPQESLGLEITSSQLGEDVRRFADLCNELAFRLWVSTSGKGLTASRSLILSPFAVTSLLAMVFLGARGPTSGQMNDILRLDDMVTFNPHLVFRNVTESVTSSKNSGVAIAAFIRELYSDRTRGKLLDFYKERAQQFYDGHVEEANFASIGDLVRRRTNLLIKRQTHGKIAEYIHGNNIMLRPPLAVFSANVIQTDCSDVSTDGRDGEMYFTVTPAMRQRRLVPVPAAVWRSGFLAGYEPGLDATAVSLGNGESQVSVILVLPGQQGQLAPGDGLARLETRLIEASLRNNAAWSRLLRSLVARPGLELQLPRFSHRSLLNLTSPLQRMGLRDLFSAERADLRGINGLANDLHLSDIVQVNTFSTCAEENSIGSRHHAEVYPSSSQRSGRKELHARKLDADDLSSLPLALRPRQARLPDSKPRLRFDRPFLYFVRHNPTGLILHMGRFNPRIRH